MNKPQVIVHKVLAMQVCVPENYTDDMVKEFADRDTPCGTRAGWIVAHDGDECLLGAPARVPCAEREGFVHVVVAA